jgi:hypothetical protein
MQEKRTDPYIYSTPRLALDPDIIAAEIVEDLQAALAQFAEIAADLRRD